MRPTDALAHPSDWTVKTVKEAVEIRRGLSWSKDQESDHPRDGAVPVLRIGNIQDRLDLSDILYVTGVPEKAKTIKNAEKGWSIIVGSNGNRNRVGNAVFQSEDTDFLFASFLIAAKPREGGGILPEFFYRWLCAHEIQSRLSASSEGTTGLSNLSHNFFKAMEIAFPEEWEQQEIVRILDAVDAAIDRTRTAIDQARRLAKSVLQKFIESGVGRISAADRPGTSLADGWRLVPTADLLACEPKNGISPPAETRPPGYPTFSIAAVRDGRINLMDEKHLKYVRIRPELAAEHAVRRGDLLIVRGNANPELVGCCGIVSDFPEDCIYPDILKRIVLKNGDCGVLPQYAVLVWNHPVIHNQILKRAKTSTGTLKINSRDVKQIIMPVPPLASQEKIVTIFKAIELHEQALKTSLSTQERLKRGLMQNLLTGRVRVKQVKPQTAEPEQLALPFEAA